MATAALAGIRLGGLRRAGVILVFSAAILLGSLAGIFLAYESDLPQVSSLEDFQPNIITEVYTADGKLGASAATFETWFQRGNALRASGGYPPPGFIEDVGSTAERSYVAKGTVASQIIATNNPMTIEGTPVITSAMKRITRAIVFSPPYSLR